jgi:hypothetical protein
MLTNQFSYKILGNITDVQLQLRVIYFWSLQLIKYLNPIGYYKYWSSLPYQCMKDENEFQGNFLTSKLLMKNITHLKCVKRIESNHENLGQWTTRIRSRTSYTCLAGWHKLYTKGRMSESMFIEVYNVWLLRNSCFCQRSNTLRFTVKFCSKYR